QHGSHPDAARDHAAPAEAGRRAEELAMTHWLKAFAAPAALLAGLAALLAMPLLAQQQDAGPEVPYDAVDIVTNLKMPPGIFLGEAAGVDVNSKGHIFVYSRTGDSGHILYRRSAQLFE